MNKKYIVRLTDQERDELAAVIKKFKGTSQKVRRAQILSKADADGPNWTDHRIVEAFGCRTQTVEKIRQRLVERGFRETLDGGKRETPPVEKLLSGEQEARIIATRLGSPPPGYANWTLRLLARKVVELGIVGVRELRDGAADAEKNGMTNRKIEYWVIPPEADGEFVAHMEEVLETYAKPYNPMRPVLCMDEQPVQLLKETRVPIPATRRHAKRVDYEYERAGTANIFMFAEPLAGWREVAVRETKTKVDWAIEMASLMEGRYADAERVDRRVRQLEHAHQGRLLRELRTRPGASTGPPHRLLLHAQARQLAEHRRERTQLPDTPVRGRSPLRRRLDAASGDHGLVIRRQQHPARRRLANEDRRRPLQTHLGLP